MRKFTEAEQSAGEWTAANSMSKRAQDGYFHAYRLKVFKYDSGGETRYAYEFAGYRCEDLTIGQLECFLERLEPPEEDCSRETGNCMNCERALRNNEYEYCDCCGEKIQASREAMEAEAVERMFLMGLSPVIIRDFELSGLVSQTIGEACYWLDKETMRRVRHFELTYHAVVYHVVPTTFSDIGKTEAYFYVGSDPTTWDSARQDIHNGEQICYVQNLTYLDCSQFGDIGFSVMALGAGLKREW